VEAAVAALPTEREFDFVKELAARVPAAVIADILGVPSSDVDRHLHWSEGIGIFLDIVKSEEQRAHATRCLREMWDYFDRATAAPSGLPEGALMGRLAALCERSEMTREEMLAMCCLLSAAGQETTANLLANAMCALLERPELADRLRRDEPSLPTFVEEVLRTDGPIMGVPRVATQDVCLRDRPVHAGDYLIVVTAAANRDPARYDAPDDLTVDGPARPHLAFGQGRHYCLGAALARVEAVAVLSCCLRQRRFEPARPLAEIHRKSTQVLRGPAELWVRAPVRSAPRSGN
jgi:cytochrome P450